MRNLKYIFSCVLLVSAAFSSQAVAEVSAACANQCAGIGDGIRYKDCIIECTYNEVARGNYGQSESNHVPPTPEEILEQVRARERARELEQNANNARSEAQGREPQRPISGQVAPPAVSATAEANEVPSGRTRQRNSSHGPMAAEQLVLGGAGPLRDLQNEPQNLIAACRILGESSGASRRNIRTATEIVRRSAGRASIASYCTSVVENAEALSASCNTVWTGQGAHSPMDAGGNALALSVIMQQSIQGRASSPSTGASTGITIEDARRFCTTAGLRSPVTQAREYAESPRVDASGLRERSGPGSAIATPASPRSRPSGSSAMSYDGR